MIKTDVVQSILLGSVCRTFLFFPGLSFRFLNATSLPAPSERKVILGVERSLNLTSFGIDSPVGTCFSSLPFDEFSFFLETERIKVLFYFTEILADILTDSSRVSGGGWFYTMPKRRQCQRLYIIAQYRSHLN